MLQPGDSLAGYRIESVAGVGGMGVVYRAVQESLDRPVALKVLSSTLVGNRTFRERFRREGRHAAALDHPNIIPVYEAGESNGLMFIAMRLVDGPSLADLNDRRELSGRDALRIVGAIGGALDAAHEAGLVHRDIKPQNMLITRNGHPYLADFGITKGSDHAGLTHSGDFVGSLNYVAPEQIEGKDVGGESDIYSLTAVLFQALSGAHPYQRDTDAALMHAHLSADPPTFAARGIIAPAALDAVFARGMAKDPADRFPTAGALIDACSAALSGVDERTLSARPAFPLPGAAPIDDRNDAAAATTPDALGWVDPPSDITPSAPLAAPVAADATTADTRRDAVGAAPSTREQPAAPTPAPAPRAPRDLPAWLAPAGAVALVLVAVIAGFALGHQSAPPEPVRTASAGVALMRDAGWAPGTGTVEGITVDQPITLRTSGGVKLTAGRLTSAPASFNPMPKTLQARLADGADVRTVRLGARQFVRTQGALKTGDRLWAGFTPDERGWVAIVCDGPNADARCPVIAATLTTPGAKTRTMGPSADSVGDLESTLKKLSAARERAATGLAAKSTAKRAEAAVKLAAAHGRAAAAMPDVPDAWEARWVGRPFTALRAAFTAEQRELARMASAAKAKDRARYANATAKLKVADRQARAALDDLENLGYIAS